MTSLPSLSASEGELASRLRLVVTRLARRLRTQLPGDLSPSQLATLSSAERLGPLTLGELSNVERVKPPTMTKIVACLEEQGLVTRTVDQKDRRVARVQATPTGLRFLEDSRQQKDAYLAERLRALDPADRAALERAAEVLERLLEDR
ncbi:MAG: MarR family winged helix-turn-helix transcriptional regulator [Acidimicrobiales bacterium]